MVEITIWLRSHAASVRCWVRLRSLLCGGFSECCGGGNTAEGAVKGARGGEGNHLNAGGERIFDRLEYTAVQIKSRE